jgi:hypothetical protein
VAPPPSPAPAPPSNHISSGNGAIDTGVGWYSDCSGRSIVPHGDAVIDTCVPGRLYLLGHNPGVFSGAFSLDMGATLTYNDSSGVAHHYRVVGVRTIETQSSAFPPATVRPDVSLQLQTCVNSSGSVVRLIDAVSI